MQQVYTKIIATLFFLSFSVKCSDLEAVSNGSQVFSSTGSQTTVTVTCDIGYSLEGQNTLTCDSNGSWTSTIPSCGNISDSLNVGSL